MSGTLDTEGTIQMSGINNFISLSLMTLPEDDWFKRDSSRGNKNIFLQSLQTKYSIIVQLHRGGWGGEAERERTTDEKQKEN